MVLRRWAYPIRACARGGAANLVILQARDPIEAVRLRAARLLVMRGGRVLARGAPRRSTLDLPGRPASVDPAAYAPIEGGAGR